MATKICPKCGQERPARGFNFHVDSCKGEVIEEQLELLPDMEIISDTPTIVEEIEKMEAVTEKVLKDVPGIFVQSAILSDLNKERERTKQASKEAEEDSKPKDEDGECICKRFDGESLFCPVHKPIVCCPGCNCIKTETKITYMDPLQEYRCQICGLAYKRHMGTGEYSYE